MIRNILSVVAGLVVAILCFLAIESINSNLHDFSGGFSNMPTSFWLILLLGWIVGSFGCGIVIKLISRTDNKRLPAIAGGILMLSAVANFYSIPHPVWVIVVGMAVFIPFVFLGSRIIKAKHRG